MASQLPLTTAAVGLTDVGKVREKNEDCFLIDPDLQLFVLADGMGGHAGGAVASLLAVNALHEEVRRQLRAPIDSLSASTLRASLAPAILSRSVAFACSAVFQRSQEMERLAGMGTTLTTLFVVGAHGVIAHVGDSRAYLLRDGAAQLLTEDHSLVSEQLRSGMITAQQALVSPFRNIITRSVGFESEVQIDVTALALQSDDRIVLCSDGLANKVEAHEILAIVSETPLFEAPKKLIEIANDRGGEDNVTVVIVVVTPSDAGGASKSPI